MNEPLKQALEALEHLTYTYEDELTSQSFSVGIDAIKALREFLKEQE